MSNPAEGLGWILSHSKKKIHCREVWCFSGWKIKIYCIGDEVDDKFIKAGKLIAAKKLPTEPFTSERYGAGFLIIHPASLFNQVTIDWWERTNELRHHVFKSIHPDIYSFENITASGEAFFVWEIKIISFEKDIWLRTILEKDSQTLMRISPAISIGWPEFG